MHIFCLPMHLFHHMYKRLCIGRHRFHNEKVTYTAFITVLWIVYVQIFKTLEWKKLLEIKIIFWVLMKKKLACPPKPVSSSIYIYIHIYIYIIYSNKYTWKSAQHKSLVLLWEEHDSKQLYLVLKVSCRSTGNVSTSCNNQKKKKKKKKKQDNAILNIKPFA